MSDSQEQGSASQEPAVPNPLPFSVETPCGPGCAEKFLDAFRAILKHSNYAAMLDQYARVDMRCGHCADMCQIYKTTKDPKDSPCYRTQVLLNIYRNYFMLDAGKKSACKKGPLQDRDIIEFVDSYYRCTTCRRCTQECPAGIDHALVTHLGRYILSEMGVIPKPLQAAVRNQIEGGHNNIMNMSLPALQDTVEFLEEDLQDLTGQEIRIPIGKRGVDYIFYPPVSDFMSEAETLMGHAAVFHAMGLGDNWTISDQVYDSKNYGYYYSDWIFERVMKTMAEDIKRLGGKFIVIGECGHATKASKIGMASWHGPKAPHVLNSIELLYDGVVSGKLKLNPDAVTEKVTYHDPCNIGRNYGLFDEPRYILKQFCRNFVELKPNRAMNWCCGGGPSSMDDTKEFRMDISGKLKAEQLKNSGADIVVSPCANCKKQISELIAHHGLNMQRSGLHDLVLKAIVWD